MAILDRVIRISQYCSKRLMRWAELFSTHSSLWVGNYQQPQIPAANMAGADLDMEGYSLFIQISSTDSGDWDV